MKGEKKCVNKSKQTNGAVCKLEPTVKLHFVKNELERVKHLFCKSS